MPIYVLSLDQPPPPSGIRGEWTPDYICVLEVFVSLEQPFAAFPCYEGVSVLREPLLYNRRFLPLPLRKGSSHHINKIIPPGANMEGRLGLGETPRMQAGLTVCVAESWAMYWA